MPVLGALGQDGFFDSYNFRSEPEDERAAAEGIYGEFHVTCLVKSKWMDFVHLRLLQNHAMRGFEDTYEDQDSRVLRSQRRDFRGGGLQDYLLLFEPGVMLVISNAEVRRGLRVDDSSIELWHHVRNWEMPGSLRGLKFEELFGSEGRMPLMRLVEAFGVADKLLDKRRAAEAWLNVEEKGSKKFFPELLVGTVQCSVTLPKGVVEYLAQCESIKGGNSRKP